MKGIEKLEEFLELGGTKKDITFRHRLAVQHLPIPALPL